MCDVIEIGVQGALIWSITKKDGVDVCLCANYDEEVYAYCVEWVRQNVPKPSREERVVIEHTPFGWGIYKERKARQGPGMDTWVEVYFADEYKEEPQTDLGKKLKDLLRETTERG